MINNILRRISPQDLSLYLWYGAASTLVAYVLLTWQFSFDQPFHGWMFYTYNNILAGQEGAPYQYRYVSYLLPEILRQVTGLSLQTAEAINRAMWLWVCLLALHAYTLPWLKRSGAIIAVMAFLGAASLFVVQTSFAPSDLPTLFFLILSLLALHRQHYAWLVVTLPLGMLFRETILFFFVVWGVYFLFEADRRQQLPFIIGAGLTTLSIYIGLRLYFGFDTYNPYTLPYNLSDTRWLLRVILLFNVFWILPWLGFRSAPKFLRYTVILVPVVVVANVVFAFAKDSRLWLPLVPVLFPLGLLKLLADKPETEVAPIDSP